MKMNINIFLGLVMAFLLVSNNWAWGQAPPVKDSDFSFGGSSEDFILDAIITSDGGNLIMSQSLSPANGNKTSPAYGSFDIWLIKTDASGTLEWQQTYGSTGYDERGSLLELPGGGYAFVSTAGAGSSGNIGVSGYGSLDIWVLRLDALGNKIWEKLYGGTETEFGNDITLAPGGGFFVTGTSLSSVSGNKTSPSFGDWDGWLIKIDDSGNILWDKSFGGTGYDEFYDILTLPDGSVAVGGNSGSAFTGTRTTGNNGNSDFWIARIDDAGTQIWDASFGGSGQDAVDFLEYSPDGNLYVGGRTQSASISEGGISESINGPMDGWILKMDLSGSLIWHNLIGSSGWDQLRGGWVLSDGSIVVGSTTNGAADGDQTAGSIGESDLWLLKIDPSGSIEWDQTFGGVSSETGCIVQQNALGQYILYGHSNSPVSGDKSQANFGGQDIWMLMTTPDITCDLEACEGQSLGFAPSTSGVTYAWDFGDGTTSTDANPTHAFTTAGNYTVELIIVDGDGCSNSETQLICVSPAVTVALTAVEPVCNGSTDGSIDLTATGGAGTLTYVWAPGGETTEDLSGLGAGTYTVTVSDPVTGCEASDAATLTDPALLDANFVVTKL